ncbi:UDP-N-acetylglucosamine 2-epimerase (non-hydrolyzing) [Corallococcus sp. M34]|uniref:non-hydrolyzing UDP-N-acetylglucosamine 2-epimerase n=1 Tax=Citreicoccus inhibens TaxID=2849499 RepID=UPI001C21A488|nr:UDP-N-acetylglucosamine 2-epimerase (non-hydrolyzing) [Citreicoccus inhibens]MBU8896272.1 UDP-N-acetylglucosamine 2-epimerase (non-hydrolyzing) [Citreicoccus inhibens]
MRKVIHIVGARPNFMKVAPIYKAIRARGVLHQRLVHTGQHYDVKMSDVFFSDLGLPAPEVHLGIGSGSHAEQTARMMVEMEKVFLQEKPDLVSVVGDVNSTLAAALVTSKLAIPLAHVEAGLRSRERYQPEEVNRVVTDRLSELLLTPSRDADANLLEEGVPSSRIHFVGNVMIDSLLSNQEKAEQLSTLRDLGLSARQYAVATLHRPVNVDDPKLLVGLIGSLRDVARRLPLVFPVHPRTRKMLTEQGWLAELERAPGMKLVEPMGYLEFLALTSQARVILTDSGGLQEEATALGVPCLTLREQTERPVTVEVGTNEVVGTDAARILAAVDRILAGQGKQGRVPELWDGRTGERIADLYARSVGAQGQARASA